MKLAIEELLSVGESERVEFKQGLMDQSAVACAVCGLLNANGGFVFIGVNEQGKSVESFTLKDASHLEAKLRSEIVPPAVFSVCIEETTEHQIISIDIPAGSNKPYIFENKIYVRVGTSTLAAQPAQASELVSKRIALSNRWERRQSLDLDLEDLDLDLIRKTVYQATTVRGYIFRNLHDIEQCLADLSVFRQGQFTHAADVLYGRRVASRIPQTRARAIRFKSDRESAHIDERIMEGPAPLILEELMDFVQRHTAVSATFQPEQVERIIHSEIPYFAVREGITNALVHRDYTSFSGSVAVRIYPNRIEIWNSGTFPPGINATILHKLNHPSVLVNPDISMGFYLLNLMERAGRGAYTIIQECRRANLKEPIWSQDDNSGVLLTLFTSAQKASVMNLKPEHLAMMKDLRLGQIVRVADYPDYPARTTRRRLGELVVLGYLERHGEGRATTYTRTEKSAGRE